MSLTIQATPGTNFSAQGDLIYTVYGSNYAQPNYKYIADVYIGANKVATIKRVPYPDNHIGVFNIGDIVRSYVNSVFNPVANQLKAQELGDGEWHADVQMKFGEEYGATEYPNLTIDSVRTYFNHYNGRMFGQLTILDGVYVDGVISTRPAQNTVMSGAAYNFLPYFAESAGSSSMVIELFAGSVSQGSSIVPFTPTAANNLILFNLSPGIVGANAATTHYTVTITGGVEYRFDIICEAVYTNYTVHFLNKFGGFESRNFTKVSRKTVAITKTDFGKLPYSIDVSGNVSYYNANGVYNETRSTYASQYMEKMTLNTDIVTDEEYQWLGELFISPSVYIELNGYFIPVAITSNNYEYKKRVNDKLTNITMDIEYGDNFSAQYR